MCRVLQELLCDISWRCQKVYIFLIKLSLNKISSRFEGVTSFLQLRLNQKQCDFCIDPNYRTNIREEPYLNERSALQSRVNSLFLHRLLVTIMEPIRRLCGQLQRAFTGQRAAHHSMSLDVWSRVKVRGNA